MEEMALDTDDDGVIVIELRLVVFDFLMLEEREVLRMGANGFDLYSNTC